MAINLCDHSQIKRENPENSICESNECAIFILASDGTGFMILGNVFVLFEKF